MIKFQFDGMQDALRNLREIELSVTTANLTDDIMPALEKIAEDARALAPVDEGELRDSIAATEFADGTVGVIIEDWKGHFFEYGTVKMRPQPMLGPAWYANEEMLINFYTDAVKARLLEPTGGNRSRVGIAVEV